MSLDLKSIHSEELKLIKEALRDVIQMDPTDDDLQECYPYPVLPENPDSGGYFLKYKERILGRITRDLANNQITFTPLKK